MRNDGCVFCRIIDGSEPATIVQEWSDALAIVPLNPVADGHVIVLPVIHVEDVTSSPRISAVTMARAAHLAEAPCNVITSAGVEATQTVPHLHIHIVPRRVGDGLKLPWSEQAGVKDQELNEKEEVDG